MKTKKYTQKEIILNELFRKGKVNNASAFTGKYNNRNILRLGALIHDLRKEGFDIITFYKDKKGFRNTVYKIIEDGFFKKQKKLWMKKKNNKKY